jgi:hypothetical protein
MKEEEIRSKEAEYETSTYQKHSSTQAPMNTTTKPAAKPAPAP